MNVVQAAYGMIDGIAQQNGFSCAASKAAFGSGGGVQDDVSEDVDPLPLRDAAASDAGPGLNVPVVVAKVHEQTLAVDGSLNVSSTFIPQIDGC